MQAADLQLIASFTPEGGASIQFQRTLPGRGLFKRATTEMVPVAHWADADDSGQAIRLLDRINTGAVTDAGDHILLDPATVAALGEDEALALGLPPAAPLVLSLRGSGLITDAGFKVHMRWMRANGMDVAADVTGAHAVVNGRDYRLPEPLFHLLAAAQAVNAATDVPGQQAAFAELRLLLEEQDEHAFTDGVLRETRVAFASNFSLELTGENDGTSFDPVLFAPRIGSAASGGTIIDAESDNLLTPRQQESFARVFRQAAGQRRSYLLADGLLLFIDPSLVPALEVVGEKQRAPAAERRRFAASPRRAIAEATGEDADCLESLFIETTQYSSRVIGIDPWRMPVLPWVKPRPNSWLPDSFGLSVGDPPVRITLDPADVPAAIEKVSGAMAAGIATVSLASADVPATPATLDALHSLNLLTEEKDQPEESSPAQMAEKLFLQVQDNLDEVAYAPLVRAEAPPGEPAEVPPTVTTSLKPHQAEGFRWLADAWRSVRPGVLLADDMGLGKTLQALSFFCWLRHAQRVSEPVLIVAPTGLLSNWQAEMARHLAPDALGPVVRAYGTGLKTMRRAAGTDITRGAPLLDIDGWRGAGVVLTTYETLRDYHFSFASVSFAVLAFDEAQRIKNPSSQITRAAKTLRARLTIAITGTPVENRLQDLWSIADVLHPGMLGSSKSFEERYRHADTESLRELNGRLTTAASPWPPFMLRRMKADHIEGLPAKRQIERVVPMPPEQANAYAAAINRALSLRGSGNLGAILQTLTSLRSISLAPEIPRPGSGFASQSARLQAVIAILDELAARQEKALIFCESLEMQPILAAELRRRYHLDHSVPCISGSVPGDQRQRLVDEFQKRGSGFDVMILSPRAGGVGLTITAANHVIHLTRWWNPAVEDQATDRVYRIGQTRDVTVWIPIAEHPDPALGPSSFDRRLAELLDRKRTLAHGLLMEPESADDARQLFDNLLGATPDAR